MSVPDRDCHTTSRTILPNVSSLFIEVNEFPQRSNDVDVLSCPCHTEFGALMEAVVEYFERFQYMAPVLALVVESLIEHVHNLVEIGRTVELSGQ